MSVHIYPQNDTHPHTLTADCECSPKPDRNGYLIHKSFDGRESHPNDGTGELSWTFEITEP